MRIELVIYEARKTSLVVHVRSAVDINFDARGHNVAP
jgi:hypothetical protein